MKKILLIIVSVFCICSTGLPAIADDAPLATSGSDVYPINNPNIKMESEVIKINYDKKKVDVVFNFKNTSNETDLDVGFPVLATYPGELNELKNFKAFEFPSMKPIKVGKKKCKSYGDIKDRQYSGFYTWKMHFKKNEKLSMRVSYEVLSPEGIEYVLKTGAYWKDKIDKIDVYVDFSNKISLPKVDASPRNFYYNGKGIEWHFKNIEPDFNLNVVRKKIPMFFKEDKSNYSPKQISLTDSYLWDDQFYYVDTLGDNFGISIIEALKIRKTAGDDIEYLENNFRKNVKNILEKAGESRNEIMARHGYIFKHAKWKKYFEKMTWYKPDKNFNINKLNATEMANLEYIKKFESMVNLSMTEEKLEKQVELFIRNYNILK